MKAIIFAGGVGTRLWPLSRKSSPKQFEKVMGNKSTLQLSVERLMPTFGWDDIYVSTGKTYVDIVKKQLTKIPPSHVVGEPEMRDVGPAVGLMTAILYNEAPKTALTILWSDHVVKREELFRDILLKTEEYINNDPEKIIFIGQKPRYASQNLGWIEFGSEVAKAGNFPLHSFKSFHYRPEISEAKKYFESGHHAWNLGYFVTTPLFLWKQYEKHAPDMFSKLKKIQEAYKTDRFDQVLSEIYPQLDKISFDNLILEKLDQKQALVVSENLEWSDVGTWEALKEALQNHELENVTSGKVLVQDCQDTLVYNYTDQLVVGIDLKGFLVVNTGDVTLVAHKDSVPKIKKIVESFVGTENEKLT